MATYKFYGESAAGYPKKRNPGSPTYQRKVDVPDLIANGGLANTSDVATALPSTGFASSSVLQVFQVPAGFVLTAAGVYIDTVEGGTLTLDVGNASATQTQLLTANADGYVGTIDANDVTTTGGAWMGLIADEDLGGSTYEGVFFLTDGSINVTFNNAADTVVFIVWANGFFVDIS